MSKISLTTEQYDLLKVGGMSAFFRFISEDMYEIMPMNSQDGYSDDDICYECYEREQREKALNAALHLPATCLRELLDNAEAIQRWLEGGV